MKTVIAWVVIPVILIGALRIWGQDIRDRGDKFMCSYRTDSGECLTQKEYIEHIARAQADFSVRNLVLQCSSPFNRDAVECAAFHQN